MSLDITGKEKPVFTDGQGVSFNLDGQLKGEGWIRGLASEHLIDMWVVEVASCTGIDSKVYPWSCIVVPHTLLRANGANRTPSTEEHLQNEVAKLRDEGISAKAVLESLTFLVDRWNKDPRSSGDKFMHDVAHLVRTFNELPCPHGKTDPNACVDCTESAVMSDPIARAAYRRSTVERGVRLGLGMGIVILRLAAISDTHGDDLVGQIHHRLKDNDFIIRRIEPKYMEAIQAFRAMDASDQRRLICDVTNVPFKDED